MIRVTVIVIKFAPSKTLISPWAILARTINILAALKSRGDVVEREEEGSQKRGRNM